MRELGSLTEPDRVVLKEPCQPGWAVSCRMQPRFLGSWSSLWPRAGFWRADPATAAAVLRLSFAPAAAAPFASDAAAQQPNAAPAAPGQRMPSQPAAHPMEAVSALAQRSARTLWYGSHCIPSLVYQILAMNCCADPALLV